MSPSTTSPNPQPPTSNPSRQGFTLVELLMVITIIGMLVALVSVAAVRAIGTARNAQITTEISLLDTAMQSYKNEIAGGAPPDCTLMTAALGQPASSPSPSQAPVAQDSTNRQNRILSHFRKAYPRVTFPYGYGSASQTGSLQYAMNQAFLNYDAQSSTPPVKYSGYTALTTGAVWGDLDNLDPAEALVFWLGGPPAPPYLDTSTGKWAFTLRGFGANKLNPLDLISSSREVGPFEFQQSRLGDADGDGWPEYYPPVGEVAQPPNSARQTANAMPPYVYFDAVSYAKSLAILSTSAEDYPQSALYPSPLSSGTVAGTGKPGIQPNGGSAATWGCAMPYVQSLTPPSSGQVQATWVNPQKFQIICAGLDRQYWFDPSGALTVNQIRLYPAGTAYSQGDLDNLTNFSTSALRDAQP